MTLHCGMVSGCTHPVTHIGDKGFVYCAEHAALRRADGRERCRKMRKWELRLLRSGQPLPSYEPRPKPAPEPWKEPANYILSKLPPDDREKVCDRIGCNIYGRLSVACQRIEEAAYDRAEAELRDILKFVRGMRG
jgi:hypothetical protein